MMQSEIQLPPRLMVYPPSLVLKGLEWAGEPAKYPGTGSDMHWCAWGDDDAMYFVDDDGANFGSKPNFANLLRATGTPPNFKLELVSQFPGLKRHNSRKLRYVDGALALGSRLFVAAYDYDFSDPGREVHTIGEDQMDAFIANPTEAFFINAISRHSGVAALMYSDDYGKTWQNLPDEHTPNFLGPRFAGLAFVGFGKGYSGVPAWLGDYVYAISNDESWESGNHVFLARVSKDRLLDRTAWQFYAGGGHVGNPVWLPDEVDARPILSDPGHVGHPTMTYNPRLKRFLLCFGSDIVPHSHATPRDFARAHWHRQRELHVYESSSPWGPWYLVHYDSCWEGEHVAYLPQMPAKWLHEDGLGGTLVFSGDYSMTPRMSGYQSYYGFMTRSFRLIPR